RARAGRRAAGCGGAPPRRRAGRRRGRRCARAARAPGGGGQRRRRTRAHREHDARGGHGRGRARRGARRARRAWHLARRHRPPAPPARDGGAAAPRRAPPAAEAPGRSRALRCDRRGGRAARRAVRLGRILVAGAIFAGVVALTFPTDALVRWALTRALPPGGPRLEFDHATLRPWGVRLAPVTLRDAPGYRLAAADWPLAHPSLPGFLHDRTGRPWRATGAAYGGTFAALLGREATDLEWHDLDLARMPTLKVGGERLEGTTGGAATLKGAAGEGTLGVRRMTWPSAARFLVGAEAMRSEEHTSELQSLAYLVCRLLLEKKNDILPTPPNHPHISSILTLRSPPRPTLFPYTTLFRSHACRRSRWAASGSRARPAARPR